jgi:hypothetical protein
MDEWKRREKEENKNNRTHQELAVRYAEEISLRWILPRRSMMSRRSMSRACGWTKLRQVRKKCLPKDIILVVRFPFLSVPPKMIVEKDTGAGITGSGVRTQSICIIRVEKPYPSAFSPPSSRRDQWSNDQATSS